MKLSASIHCTAWRSASGWPNVTRCLAYAGLGDDGRAGQELDAALTIEPDLLKDDAKMIVEQFQDAPIDIRITIRERLLDLLASQPDHGQPRADGVSFAQSRNARSPT